MELYTLLEIQEESIISLVGAGGKTSLLFTLGNELRKDNKVLLTTTTKIYYPRKTQYDEIAVNQDDLNKIKSKNQNGVVIYGSGINQEEKLLGVDPLTLRKELDYFSYIIVEADGSKKKPIKGWKKNEPVLPIDTTMTIGVLDFSVLGKRVNVKNVHRIDEFKAVTGASENDVITIEHLVNIIFNKNGLFKDALGTKILFINQVETKTQKKNIHNFVIQIVKMNYQKHIIDKIIIGSLKEQRYQVYSGDEYD